MNLHIWKCKRWMNDSCQFQTEDVCAAAMHHTSITPVKKWIYLVLRLCGPLTVTVLFLSESNVQFAQAAVLFSIAIGHSIQCPQYNCTARTFVLRCLVFKRFLPFLAFIVLNNFAALIFFIFLVAFMAIVAFMAFRPSVITVIFFTVAAIAFTSSRNVFTSLSVTVVSCTSTKSVKSLMQSNLSLSFWWPNSVAWAFSHTILHFLSNTCRFVSHSLIFCSHPSIPLSHPLIFVSHSATLLFRASKSRYSVNASGPVATEGAAALAESPDSIDGKTIWRKRYGEMSSNDWLVPKEIHGKYSSPASKHSGKHHIELESQSRMTCFWSLNNDKMQVLLNAPKVICVSVQPGHWIKIHHQCSVDVSLGVWQRATSLLSRLFLLTAVSGVESQVPCNNMKKKGGFNAKTNALMMAFTIHARHSNQ